MDTFAHVKALRELADAVERRRDANTLPGISAPKTITFLGHDDTPLSGYGSNPTLQEAIKREIRISWEELRQRALTRLDDSVAQLSEQVRGQLTPSPTPEP